MSYNTAVVLMIGLTFSFVFALMYFFSAWWFLAILLVAPTISITDRSKEGSSDE